MTTYTTMPSRTALATAALMALISMQRANAADDAQVAQADAAPQAAAAAPAASAPAQSAGAKAAQSGNDTQVETVVVTGTAQPRRKLEASYSITTADAEQIKQAAPSSTADLLKIVPGVYVETTGGVTGANIRVRGFPTPGDGPYSTVDLNGSPIYALPTLSFMENSSLFRLDDTIDHVEVLRGGPSPIFGSGQPGVTVNFIEKKGGDDPEGSVHFTTGSGDERRVDAEASGKIADRWYGMVGGFYRTDNGVRDTQYPANRGGQLSVQLTHTLDDGELNLYARTLNDKNAFYVDVPLKGSPDGSSVSSVPYFDALKGTFYGSELRNITLESGFMGGDGKIQQQFINRDFANGRGANITTLGATLNKKFGAWTLDNKVNYTSGDAPTYALFTGANPTTLGAYISSQVAAVNGDAAMQAAGLANATTGTAHYVDNGNAITDMNTPVIVNGMWSVDKHIQSFTDETRLNYALTKDNTLTAGLYFADYSSHDVWYLGEAYLMTATPNARPINLTLDNGVKVTRADGFAPPQFTYDIDGSYNGQTLAEYFADDWKLSEQLRVDGGLRFEQQRVSGTIATAKSGDLDNDPSTYYNNSLGYFDGTSSPLVPGGSIHLSKTSATLGANYNFSHTLSAFGRVNYGHRMPDFDTLRGRGLSDPTSPVEDITQYELGLKTATKLYTTFLTFFHNELKNSQTYSFVLGNGAQSQRATSKADGVEFEASLRPVRNLELNLTGTYQNAKYNDFPPYTGNVVERTPKLQYRFTPSYHLPTSFGSMQAYATWSYVGSRYVDQTNQQTLPSYNTLDAGLAFYFNNGMELRLTGTNLTNELGITEGNPRVVGNSQDSSGVFMGRPLFGRAYEVSVGFSFF
jgi:outer membrane receptor protein involved in Fe transport